MKKLTIKSKLIISFLSTCLVLPLIANAIATNPIFFSGFESSGFPVFVTVSGLGNNQSLTLQNNGVHDVMVTVDGTVMFHPLPDNSNYTIAISDNPNNLTCQVNNGAGQINGAPINNISVICGAVADGLIWDEPDHNWDEKKWN